MLVEIMNKRLLLPYLLCLAVLAACIETDISVPGFPDMVRYFSATEAQVQLTMSINFLGFCLAGLLNGPLSDSYGRRPVMIIGNCIFLLGCIGTASAMSIETLIAWRFLQGVGASAAFTVVFAMIADAYQGAKASELIQRINALLTAAMAGAPILGGVLVQAFGWRSTYSSVAILCAVSTLLIVFYLPETHHKRQSFAPKQVLRDFWILLKSADFWAVSLIPSLQCAGYMAFVAGAVFFYVGSLNVSLGAFTFYQGCVISCFSLVSFFGGKITARIGIQTALNLGLVLNVSGAAIMWMLAWLAVPVAGLMTSTMCLFSIGVALCYGPTFTASMELFPELKGRASSLIMTVRLFVMAVAIASVSVYANGTFIPETTLIFGLALISCGLLLWVGRKDNVRPLLLQAATDTAQHH